jgi:membrane protease subunit HflK
MPWNDNANSGQKPPGKPDKDGPKPSPWGDEPTSSADKPTPPRKPTPMRKPSGGGNGGGGAGGGMPPDFNDLSQLVTDKLKTYFGGSGAGRGSTKNVVLAVVGGAFGLWLLSGIYIVRTQDRAVITTFGAYSGEVGQGPHYRLPWPIQAVRKVPFTTLNKIDIGGSDGSALPEESLMLTGDENIVDLKFTVQWRVANAYRYVFNLDDPDNAVKAVAESAMREVVGRTELQPILTTGQGAVQLQTAKLMQSILDKYGAGVSIDEVQIRSANSPPKVLAAFREVAAAKQNAEATINRAQGEAATIKNAALGYKAQTVQEAEGEAARFNQVYVQYKAAPAVTRQRLYIETMERVLSKANKVVIDNKAANVPIVLSPDSFKSRSAPATSTDVRGARP